MTYSVGQILYVISSKTMNVFPVLVVEEIVKKTLDSDNQISYAVLVGAQGFENPVSLSSLGGDIYTSANDAKTALIDRLTKNITQLIDNAEHLASTKWPRQIVKSTPSVNVVPQGDENDISVRLDDGTLARVVTTRAKKTRAAEQ